MFSFILPKSYFSLLLRGSMVNSFLTILERRITTMVSSLDISTRFAKTRRVAVARGTFVATLVWLSMTATLPAQPPSVHYEHAGILAPGAIGTAQLRRGGPLPGYLQPVEIKAPSGALISLAVDTKFERPEGGAVRAGLLIGAVYRLRVTNIPLNEGLEVYPSIELVNRLYPPPGQELRFPVPIELAEEDLKLALQGNFITRIIYVEDPATALPVQDDPNQQRWFEVEPTDDPLAVADRLGRPIAILRMGGRLPDFVNGPDKSFFFGSPPLLKFPTVEVLPPPDKTKQPAPGLKRTATPALPRTREATQR